MSKKTKILLVEDDKKLAESLTRILTHEGYDVVHAEKPQTALSYCKLQNFDAAIVDCMLPQMNGIDLSMKLKEITGNGITLYLMSGIYKDRNFSVSALKKTNAKSFLIKPFESTSLLSLLKESFEERKTETVVQDATIRGLFFQESYNLAQLCQLLEQNSELTSSEVPLVINSLISQKATGTLLLSFEKIQFHLYFSEGKLLIESPKISSTELRSYLNRKDYVIKEDLVVVPDNLFSMKGLQEANHISPHFTKIAEKEFALQDLMNMRQNQVLTVAFKNDLIPSNLIELTTAESDDLIYDWIMSIPIIWFKAFYVKHMTNSLKKMSTHQNKTSFFPIVAANKNMLSMMLADKSISELMTEAKIDENTFYKLLHLLLVYREFYIGQKKQVTNHAAQVERLKSLLSTIEHQDAYERLGLTHNASEHDIKKSHTDLSQNLHPDKLRDSPPEIIQLSKEVYEKVQDAYNLIKSAEKREQYKRQLENQKKEKLTTSIRLLEQAYNLMVRGDFTASEPLLQEAENNTPHSQRLKLLQAWHSMKNKTQPAQQLTRVLQTLPQEEKDSAVYHHIRGLLALAAGEPDKALISFNNALAKDNDFMPARRELLAVKKTDKKNINIFSADLKDVVGLFFKKK